MVSKMSDKEAWKKQYPLDPCKEKTVPLASLENFLTFVNSRGMKMGDIFDVGCGYGAESIYLAKNGFNVTGVDINEEAINFARERSKPEKVSATFICDDVDNYLRRYKNSFDIIIESCYFHTLRKKEREPHLKQLNDALRNNGYIYLVTFTDLDPICHSHCPKRKWTFRVHFSEKGEIMRYYCSFFSKKYLENILKPFGIFYFGIEKMEYPETIKKYQRVKGDIKYRLFHTFFLQKK